MLYYYILKAGDVSFSQSALLIRLDVNPDVPLSQGRLDLCACVCVCLKQQQTTNQRIPENKKN